MTISVIPLIPTAAQTLTATLSNQRVRLVVYEKAFGLYVDVYSNDVLIIGGVVARNLVKIVRSVYLGLVGDFYFFDTQGVDDPDYTGLGSRFLLLYEA